MNEPAPKPESTSAPYPSAPSNTSVVAESESHSIELEDLPEPSGLQEDFSIKQVMQLAHDNRLFRQLMKDDVDPVAGERLLLLYRALAKQEPPLGEIGSWQERTHNLINATEAVLAGKPTGQNDFKRAVNCLGCHRLHRPD